MHRSFLEAIDRLVEVRTRFHALAEAKAILGNDNHIGDVGEYWARRYFEKQGVFLEFGAAKISPFDIKLTDDTKVSVKTMTSWSSTGQGTQIKPLDGSSWTQLFCIFLDQNLRPEKMALVEFTALIQQPEFVTNAANRSREKDPTKSYPVFRWWPWLEQYRLDFKIVADDIELGAEP